MFKKIIVGALLVGVIGVLIAGAVIRTNAKAGDGTVGEAGRGRTTVSAAAAGFRASRQLRVAARCPLADVTVEAGWS
jgi:hypothetical protein